MVLRNWHFKQNEFGQGRSGPFVGRLPSYILFFPQRRELLGSSAQISSGVCRCGSQEQVREEGSGRFRRVPACAGVGSGGRFRRQVPEGSGRFRKVPACFGVGSGGAFPKISEGSGVCWCRSQRRVPEGLVYWFGGLRRVVARAGVGSRGRVRKVPESSGVVCWLATLTGAAMWLFWTPFGDDIVHMGNTTAQKE